MKARPSFKPRRRGAVLRPRPGLWRGRDAGAKVILGSAAPRWRLVRLPAQGRYQRLDRAQPHRCGRPCPRAPGEYAPAAQVHRVCRRPAAGHLPSAFSAASKTWCCSTAGALRRCCGAAIAAGKSDCPIAAPTGEVFHKGERRLRCHHCSASQPCPGTARTAATRYWPWAGTEQLQRKALEQVLRNVQRPDGQPARIGRMDADTTGGAGQLQAQLHTFTMAAWMCWSARK